MRLLASVPLDLLAMRRRLLLLLAFAAVLLLSAVTARLLSSSPDHVELDRIFALGGATLASAFLILGWLVGRFPLIATLVLMAGVFSQDRAGGLARLYLARPVSPLAVWGPQMVARSLVAFAASVLVMPVFDLILLGQWAGPATLVLAAAWIVAFGGLVAFLSVWTRADAWIALLLGILAMTWFGLRTAGVLDGVPIGGRQFVTLVLPPHGALSALERAFGQIQPVPWSAFGDACIYGVTLYVLAALSIRIREI